MQTREGWLYSIAGVLLSMCFLVSMVWGGAGVRGAQDRPDAHRVVDSRYQRIYQLDTNQAHIRVLTTYHGFSEIARWQTRAPVRRLALQHSTTQLWAYTDQGVEVFDTRALRRVVP